VQHITHAQDAGFQEGFLSLQTLRIAGAIHPLMMLEDNFGSVAGEGDGLQDIIRHLGVGFNQSELQDISAPFKKSK
jgi:hypothetical protein